MRSGTRQEFRFFQRFESLDDFRYQPPLFFQGSTQVTASKEIPTNDQKPSFLAGRGTFRAFCVVYGLWMLFLAAVVWQVVRR